MPDHAHHSDVLSELCGHSLSHLHITAHLEMMHCGMRNDFCHYRNVTALHWVFLQFNFAVRHRVTVWQFTLSRFATHGLFYTNLLSTVPPEFSSATRASHLITQDTVAMHLLSSNFECKHIKGLQTGTLVPWFEYRLHRTPMNPTNPTNALTLYSISATTSFV